MKAKLTVLTMYLLFLFSGITHLSAQVTVGIDETPEKYATFQIKDKTIDKVSGPLDDITAEDGGVLLPRVRLVHKRHLLPFVKVTTPADTAAANTDYAKEKLLHKGLIVYNLEENDEHELCLGLNQWDGEQWNCFEVKKGNAVIDQIFCNEINVYGNYVQGLQTTPLEYIVLSVNVTKAGAYTFTVNAMFDSTTDNGYSFTANGEFLFIGKQQVVLYAQGIPTQVHFDPTDATVGDHIEIMYNGKIEPTLQCSNVVIPVTPPLADYSILCGSYKVFGIYTVLPDQTNSDDDTHYIEMDVNVSDITGGAAGWSASTDRQNGLSFRGAGSFNVTGRQKIRLYADAGSKANTYEPIELSLTAETKAGSSSCRVIIRPAFTRKKIAGIGSANTEYGYMGQRGGSRAMLLNNMNFGNDPNSTVPMVATNTPIGIAGNPATTSGTTYDFNAFEYTYYGGISNLQTAINAKPDIIIMGYDHIWTSAYAQIALQYLNEGGIILDFCENTSPRFILNAIFGISTIAGSSSTPVYSQLANFPDPLLDGPFQNAGETSLGGRHIAGDTENTMFGFSNIPPSGVIVYAYNGGGVPTALRTTGQRYILVGEGGYLTDNHNGNYSSGTIKPFAVTSAGLPMLRPVSGRYAQPIYNSFFFGNMIAWAVEQAQYYGINSK